MFKFFRFSVSIAIAALFALSLVVGSDVFLHDNQPFFYMLTLITAFIFAAMGLVGIMIYKNFKNIWQHVSKEEQQHFARTSVQKLLLVFGFIAWITTLFSVILCIGLVERMRDGMALYG
ncbi:hypothetical protein [Flavobacterium sp. N502536]|uniref:hypothetical protein n=1 Tax=Flavobacterium sp. N502536 TaxID=2986837 RepID=UPI0022227AC5|nr:hypothetical protein [Flavobacterium sp. N502536]